MQIDIEVLQLRNGILIFTPRATVHWGQPTFYTFTMDAVEVNYNLGFDIEYSWEKNGFSITALLLRTFRSAPVLHRWFMNEGGLRQWAIGQTIHHPNTRDILTGWIDKIEHSLSVHRN